MLNRRTFLQQSLRTACSVVAASSVVRIAAAQDDARKVAPFGEVTVISGNAQGTWTAIRQAVSRTAYASSWIVKSTQHSMANRQRKTISCATPVRCAKVIGTECPVIADELEGMAEGSGLRLEEHVLLTLHEELYHRGVLPPVSHCTAVAVGKPETRDGIAYVGQTWDWMPSVAGMSTMLEWRRSDGPSVLAYAFPGLWVGAGLNANGLALCWTSADLGVVGTNGARRPAELRVACAPALSGEPGRRAGRGAPQYARRLVHLCHGRRQRPTHEHRRFAGRNRSGRGHRTTDSRGLRHAPHESDSGGSSRGTTSPLPDHGQACSTRPQDRSTWQPCSARSASRVVESVSARTRLT